MLKHQREKHRERDLTDIRSAGSVEPGRDHAQGDIDPAGPEPSQRLPEPPTGANEPW